MPEQSDIDDDDRDPSDTGHATAQPTERSVDDGSVARGADTIASVLAHAAQEGFTGQLLARQDGVVCRDCDRVVNAASLDVVRVDRLEGASDVADENIVVWAHCPSCGTPGVLTLGYGPNATEADAAVLAHLDISGASRDGAPVGHPPD